jgi:hypothetical protein
LPRLEDELLEEVLKGPEKRLGLALEALFVEIPSKAPLPEAEDEVLRADTLEFTSVELPPPPPEAVVWVVKATRVIG